VHAEPKRLGYIEDDMPEEAILRVYRGDNEKGEMVDYKALHSPDLAVRWNCKAGKCGSCGGEVNGKPRLMCMDRMDKYPPGEPIVVRPMKSFPVMKDLVTDVSWNYTVNKKIPPFQMRKPAASNPAKLDQLDEPRFSQEEADRVQEFRKCIECFLCQNVCHVLRDHHKQPEFGGPRFFVRVASLEMHPLDTGDRLPLVKDELGLGYCNITKCCTEVCPEHIKITDNAIIPLKERVVDRFYDPVKKLLRIIFPPSV
jgi:succinate dehydrogenase / fumarate reductase iron-sulfur subunit